MSGPKVLPLITSCGGCPNYQYDSGSRYECALTAEIVLNKSVVAPFCPLADYPSHVIAAMEQTIHILREPFNSVFIVTLLGYVAAKLKLNVEPNGCGILIPFKDRGEDRRVYMAFDCITELAPAPLKVTFLADGKKFMLSPDGEQPILQEQAEKIKGLEDKDLYYNHYL
jgi:hypothetical protein